MYKRQVLSKLMKLQATFRNLQEIMLTLSLVLCMMRALQIPSVDAFLFAHGRFYAAGRITSMFKRSTYASGSRSSALQVLL